jgi:PKD repeat protein
MKSLTLIIALLFTTLIHTASAQCIANFVYTQQAGSNTISFVNTSSGNYSALSWYLGDGSTANTSNLTHTYAPGIYGVCLTIWDSLNGCQSTYCDTLYINAGSNCQASFTTTYQGNLIQFLNNSTGPYTQVYWNFGDGTNSTTMSPWHQFSQPGVYTVCLTVGDSATSCFDTYCQAVAFQGTGNCDASFSTVDSAGFTWFFPTVYNPNYYYYWSFGDGNSSTQSYPIHQYATQGTYLACLTVIDSSTNCFISHCDSVSNLPPAGCMAGFSYQVANGTSFFNGFNSGLGSVSSYAWIFGDGTTGTGQSPQHTYANPGTYNVCLIITTFNGCVDSVCNTIQVPTSTNCNAVINYQASNNTGYFFGSVTGGTATSYAWYFSDGTTASGQNVTHTFPASGNYIACLFITTSNGCTDSTCMQVFIPGPNGSCQPYFTYNGNVSNVVSFNNQTSGNPTNVYWNFGDGSTSTSWSPSHTYSLSGIYIVCLTVVDSSVGCSATYCDTITVGNVIGNCNAQFQYFDSLGTYFFFPINNPNYYYHWNFGDGFVSNAMYPTHFYSSAGWYNVCLTVIDSLNNCSDSWCDSIFIPNSNGCQAYYYTSIDTVTGAITFMNQSQGIYTNVVWSFGDGASSTAAMPTHTYAAPGTYIACLTIFGNNCQDSYCDTIVVGSGVNCIPMFYAVPDTLFGNGNVTFYVANSCPGWQYVWSFGDSTNGSGVGPFIHQYSATGWYYVCVTAYDNNGNALTYCDSVYGLRLASGLNEVINSQSLQLYPNPTRGDFQLKFELTKASSIIIEILSIQGQLIQSRIQEHPSGVSQMRFDLSALESGMYMIRIKTAEQQINSRFSIQQ